ncbi:MAG: CgeB family protein [Phycisphaerae bacterium]
MTIATPHVSEESPAVSQSLNIVVIGLAITSSWGNGHATTYRSLIRELRRRGHQVLFLECDRPWYRDNRDMPNPPFCRTEIYKDTLDLKSRFAADVRDADVVIVGSYVADGIAIGEWVTATAKGVTGFYDIDTPVTLAKLGRGEIDYLSPALIARYDLYLSFTGGPTLRRLEGKYGSPRALPLYCSVDPELYFPEHAPVEYDFGYLGTYSGDRQPTVERLLCAPARNWPQGRFVVAGPQYPDSLHWPANVHRITHLPPAEHRAFYNSQRFTLNVTRVDMIRAGYSPSVRLFEAAACGVPIISDWWEGIDTFFAIAKEILIAPTTADAVWYLREMPEHVRRDVGNRARTKVLSHHTAAHRAEELERYLLEAIKHA